MKRKRSSSRILLAATLALSSVWLVGLLLLLLNNAFARAESPSADLSITATVSENVVDGNQSLLHTLVLHNYGADSASQVSLSYYLPYPYFLYISCSATGGGICQPPDKIIKVRFTSLPANTTQTATITTTALTTVLSGTVVSNDFEVQGVTADPDAHNNSATLTTTIINSFDVVVTQTHTPDPVLAGGPIIYTYTVRNFGPNQVYRLLGYDFSNFQTITLPTGTGNSVTIAEPYPSEIQATTIGHLLKVTVTLHNLSHPKAEDLDILLIGPTGITTTLMSDAGGANSLENATITFADSGTPLPKTSKIESGTYRPLNNASSGQFVTDTYPAPGPGSVTDPLPYLGQFNDYSANGTWKLLIVDDNNGDDELILEGWSLALTTQELSNVPITMTAVLPNGFVVNGTFHSGWGKSVKSNVATFTRQALGSGATSTVVVTATASPNPAIYDASLFFNVPGDHNPANNLSITTTTVITNHDLAISEAVTPSHLTVNELMTYTFTITNYGPSMASNLVIIAALPTTLTINSAVPSQGNCSQNSNIITCDPGILATQALNRVVTITVEAITSGQIGWLESHSSVEPQFDPLPSNNRATTVVEVFEADTPTPTESVTATPTVAVDTATSTPVDTSVPASDTPTATPTDTPTNTVTNTPTNTPMNTPTNTPTNTSTNTSTNTPTSTATDTATTTAVNTPISATFTPTNSATFTPPTSTTAPTDSATVETATPSKTTEKTPVTDTPKPSTPTVPPTAIPTVTATISATITPTIEPNYKIYLSFVTR